MDPIVDFVVAGVQKGGTRALTSFLDQHPQIGTHQTHTPEAHFFDNDRYFDGQPPYAAYHRLFPTPRPGLVIGETTPVITFHRPSLPRVHAYNPTMKVIVLLRDPVDRAHSHWNMEHARGHEPLAFEAAVAAEQQLRAQGVDQHRVRSYVGRGFYADQLTRLFDLFPLEQCLVLRSEALRSDHDETLRTVLTFLGVDPTPPPPATVHSREYEGLGPDVRRRLIDQLADDIGRVEELLGWDLTDWMSV